MPAKGKFVEETFPQINSCISFCFHAIVLESICNKKRMIMIQMTQQNPLGSKSAML